MSKSPEQLQQEAEQAERATSLQGHQARAVLENPVFNAAWEFMRRGILEGWAGLGMRDPADQETAKLLQMQVRVLDQLKGRFEALVVAGETADEAMRRRLEEIQTREEQQDAGNVFVRGVRQLRGRFG